MICGKGKNVMASWLRVGASLIVGLMVSASWAAECVDDSACSAYTATIYEHAFGQSPPYCRVTPEGRPGDGTCEGGNGETRFQAIGSWEDLGTDSTMAVTPYTTDERYFSTMSCFPLRSPTPRAKRAKKNHIILA